MAWPGMARQGTMSAPGIALIVLGAGGVAWVLANAIVRVMDAVGLVWSEKSEARRHPPETFRAPVHRAGWR